MSKETERDCREIDPEQIEKWKLFGSILWQQRRMQRMHGKVINKAVERYPQYHVSLLLRLQEMMFDVQSHERIDMADIVRLSGDSPQMASRLIRTLEQDGLIQRHSYPEDRRRTYVLLTDKGKTITHECGEELAAYSVRIIEDLGKERLTRIRESIDELYEVMDRQLKVFLENEADEEQDPFENRR